MKTKLLALSMIVLCLCANAQKQFNHDYSKTWVSKLFLSKPDLKNGGSFINYNFEQALEVIKQMDAISLGAPKIVYLIGWQYAGHDDRYPEFFEVNQRLKRSQDKSALESLQWLMAEAKKYNTIVSLHINMTDAYDDSQLWETYKKEDLISKNEDGSLMIIGQYNNRNAYQINYRNEWEKGYTQWRIDRLIEMLPELREAGTIHIDAWIARDSKGHNQTVITEAEYQKKALGYWRSKGIDVTSEWYMDYMLGLVPYAWHFNGAVQADYIRIPANVYTGSGLNPDIKSSDHDLAFLFGTSCYGEPYCIKKGDVLFDENVLIKDFMLKFPQYYFLNSSDRLRVEGQGKNRKAYFTDDIEVSLADSTVVSHGAIIRKGNTLAIPALWRDDAGVILYSVNGASKLELQTPLSWRGATKATLYQITKEGLKEVSQVKVKNDKYTLDLPAKTAYYIMKNTSK